MYNSAYSLVEHLAKSIWFSRWREGQLAVFSAYFDASGDETNKKQKCLTVAGFVASAGVWIKFEEQWQDCLTAYKVFGKDGRPAFHMVACANCTYAFEPWQGQEGKRQKLLHDLMEILSLLGHKVSCVVNIDEYKTKLDSDVREKFDLTAAYVLGGRICAARVKEFCLIAGSPPVVTGAILF